MKWIYVSIGIASVSLFTAYLMTGNITISIMAALAVFTISIVNDPKRRYMRAFWGVISIFLILNRFFFEVVGKIADVNFILASQKNDVFLSCLLFVLAIICLLLDYKERNPEKRLLAFIPNNRRTKKSSKQTIINKGKINKQINIEKNKGKIEL